MRSNLALGHEERADTERAGILGNELLDDSVSRRETRLLRVLRSLPPEVGVLLALALVCGSFQALAPQFFSEGIWGNILVTAALDGIPAIGVVFLLIAGEFDLSVGSVFLLAPMMLSYLVVDQHWSFWLSLCIGLAVSLVVGTVNALLVLLGRLPSFIVTLGTGMFLEGIEFAITGGSPIAYTNPGGAGGRVLDALGGSIGGTPFIASTAWFVGIGLIATYILQRTRFGNWTFGSGGGADSARAVGVPVAEVKGKCFIMCAGLSGFAGIMQLAYLQQWQPTEGSTLALTAIVIATVGGASLFGGVGSIVGVLLGSVLVGSLSIGLVLVGAPSTWYESFVGAILVAAVLVNTKSRGISSLARLLERPGAT